MLFSQDRKKLRATFVDAWRKRLSDEALEPLERQIVTLLEEHPEYHALLNDADAVVDRDFSGEHATGNPFLHLSLHLALREQVGTNRPVGIAPLTRSLLLQHGDGHKVEHLMMDCLGEYLWDAQRQGRAPDEQAYLERLQRLLSGPSTIPPVSR